MRREDRPVPAMPVKTVAPTPPQRVIPVTQFGRNGPEQDMDMVEPVMRGLYDFSHGEQDTK